MVLYRIFFCYPILRSLRRFDFLFYYFYYKYQVRNNFKKGTLFDLRKTKIQKTKILINKKNIFIFFKIIFFFFFTPFDLFSSCQYILNIILIIIITTSKYRTNYL